MSRPDQRSRIQVDDEVLFQDLNGEGVLLNLKTGVYFGLDAVGTRIWRLLEAHAVVSDVVGALMDEYDVASERCLADVCDLLVAMQEHGLVTWQHP